MSPTTDHNILVVDDDELLRQTMARALKRCGYGVYEADSLMSTQAIVSLHSIKWVVLDLRLGTESGLTTAAWLLNNNPDIQVVMITGYAAITTAVDAIKLGVKDYLIKPVSVIDIINAFGQQTVNINNTIKAEPLSPKRLEWEHIQKVLSAHNGNVSQAAKALKMHRRTLQRKLQKKPVKD